MLLCGACGRRLTVRYKGNGGLYPMYQCVWKHREGLASRACLDLSAVPLDKAITDRLVGAITPVTIELALAALTHLEERDRAMAHSGGCGSNEPAMTPILPNDVTKPSIPATD
jgi:hypothetical protein